MSVNSIAATMSVADFQNDVQAQTVVADSGNDQYLGNNKAGTLQFTASINKGQWGYDAVPMHNDKGPSKENNGDKGDKGGNSGNGNGNKVGSDNKVDVHIDKVEIGGCSLKRDK